METRFLVPMKRCHRMKNGSDFARLRREGRRLLAQVERVVKVHVDELDLALEATRRRDLLRRANLLRVGVGLDLCYCHCAGLEVP